MIFFTMIGWILGAIVGVLLVGAAAWVAFWAWVAICAAVSAPILVVRSLIKKTRLPGTGERAKQA